jgi:hypothetical protein
VAVEKTSVGSLGLCPLTCYLDVVVELTKISKHSFSTLGPGRSRKYILTRYNVEASHFESFSSKLSSSALILSFEY